MRKGTSFLATHWIANIYNTEAKGDYFITDTERVTLLYLKTNCVHLIRRLNHEAPYQDNLSLSVLKPCL